MFPINGGSPGNRDSTLFGTSHGHRNCPPGKAEEFWVAPEQSENVGVILPAEIVHIDGVVRIIAAYAFDNHIDVTFLDRCMHDDLDYAKWMHRMFYTKGHGFIDTGKNALTWAISVNNLRMVEWLVPTFGLTRDNLKPKPKDDKFANSLYLAVYYGGLDVLKWLCRELKYTKEDLRADGDRLLKRAYMRENKDMYRWLLARTGAERLGQKHITLTLKKTR